jgi:imidazolonepropionase-like amidohydrolase
MGRNFTRAGFALGAALMLPGAPAAIGAQAQQQAIVIQGGTLIDGNGGAPVPNSVVVIQGNQITAAGPAGQVRAPGGARVINAAGKYVLPGLWDSQASYSWTFGEADLHWGVTSEIDIGLGGEVSIAARDAVNAGLQRGPREWIGVAHFGGMGPEDILGYETPFDGRQLPRTSEALQAHTKQLLVAGADMIMFHDGNWDPAWVRSACDAAHTFGRPCFMRASGPKMGIVEAANAGVDVVHHARGASEAMIRDGVRPAGNAELDRFAVMDDAKARTLIQLLVREQVHLVPAIIHEAPGYPRDWADMQAAYEEQFSNPALLAYYDPGYLRQLEQTRRNVNRGPLRERRMPGYQNMLRFYRMLVEAGGQPLVGGDTNGGKVPGSIVHEEMAIWQEAGIPTMKIIQATTAWPAAAMRVNERIGTVTRGKLADVLIVNADPLADIRNLRNIDTVIQNGKVVDRAFTASYSVPFAGHDPDDRYTVNDQQWVRSLKREFGPRAGGGGGEGGGGGGGAAAQAPNPAESPFPAIEAIAPTMVRQNSPATTLSLKGFNFVAGSQVLVDGVAVPYRRVSPTELQVALDANLLRRAGRFPIVVKNPAPLERYNKWGDGTSNAAYLIVRYAP